MASNTIPQDAAAAVNPNGSGGNGASNAQNGTFRFSVDEVSDKEILGWINAPEQPSRHCVVALKEGAQTIARVVASIFRSDLKEAGIGDGCHAFALPLPARLFDGGEHLLSLVEEDSGFRLTETPILWRASLAPSHAFAGANGEPVLEARSESGAPAPAAPGLEPPAAARMRRHIEPALGTRILFDVSDLVYYVGHHANLTGIQRVQSSIVLSILANELLPRPQLTFLSFNARTRTWVVVPTGFLETLLQDLFLPEAQRLVAFPAEEARYGLLPGAQPFEGAGVLDDGNPSVLCLLGAAWVHQDYIHRVLTLKRRFGTRFVMTVHDLIPIYARETCDQDTARVFEDFMRRALRHADHVLSVSQNTARDIERYTATLQIAAPPITVTRNGSSFAEFLPGTAAAGDLRAADLPERFVLYVATIEGRKNHQLLLDIWQRMIARGEDPPHLVCVGRLGWKSTAFISKLVETDYLGGRVSLLRDICDADLRLLYDRCLFTVFPTLYEGWGLPVGEALALGKICVCSDRASIPEVAGECGVYIDIADFEQSFKVVSDLIDNAKARKKLEAKINREYVPITWRSVAEKVVEACLKAPETPWPEPYPYTRVPYGSEIGFARPDREEETIGELLLTRIAAARKGLFLGDPLDEQAFLRGEEIRSGGSWADREDWGCWICDGAGELEMSLAPDPSQTYYAFLRLRAATAVTEQPVRISANGDPVWEGRIGGGSRNVMLRLRPRRMGEAGWRLRLAAQMQLTPELRKRLAAADSRMPTIGLERLVVVPENDVNTRLDILSSLVTDSR